jgi:hypothetical protein
MNALILRSSPGFSCGDPFHVPVIALERIGGIAKCYWIVIDKSKSISIRNNLNLEFFLGEMGYTLANHLSSGSTHFNSPDFWGKGTRKNPGLAGVLRRSLEDTEIDVLPVLELPVRNPSGEFDFGFQHSEVFIQRHRRKGIFPGHFPEFPFESSHTFFGSLEGKAE